MMRQKEIQMLFYATTGGGKISRFEILYVIIRLDYVTMYHML